MRRRKAVGKERIIVIPDIDQKILSEGACSEVGGREGLCAQRMTRGDKGCERK